MDIKIKNLDILFRRISPQELLDSILKERNFGKTNISHNRIEEKMFLRWAEPLYSRYYTEHEILNIFNMMGEEMKREAPFTKKTFFNLLLSFAEKVIIINNRSPLCIYEQILNWREISNKLGQDLFTCAYIAYNDLKNNEETSLFTWDAIIRTDNLRLENILKVGMAENHFHLFGSAQSFDLSWLVITNHYSSIGNIAKKFNKRYLTNDVLKNADYSHDSIESNLKRAALIRAYLFKKIHSWKKSGEDTGVDELLNDLADPVWADVDIEVLRYAFGKRDNKDNILDYSITNTMDERNFSNPCYSLSGERCFLYHCFRKIYSGNFTDIEINLFYLYILIKNQFRGEMVQLNDKIGFINFKHYQDRKDYATSYKVCYSEEVVNLAINASLQNQNIPSFEVRIIPKDITTLIKNVDRIQKETLESKKFVFKSDALEEKSSFHNGVFPFFYTLHLPKSSEKDLKDENDAFVGRSRNFDTRKGNKKRALAIASVLRRKEGLRSRIKGIDGCSDEIGCRPEALAVEIRYLNRFGFSMKDDNTFGSPSSFMSLPITFHVGEDYLDLADGLRAIDEAILFLKMRRNHRLGHALALGIDPFDYYRLKNNKIILSKQNALDNIAWLCEKVNVYGINIDLRFQNKLNAIFNHLSMEIYGKFADAEKIEITIQDYIKAWKLRGDSPELYRSGEYKPPETYFWCGYENFMKNDAVSDQIRNSKNCGKLYYAYHFDQGVRNAGFHKYIFEVDADYINLVNEIQRQMQFEIAEEGISIETNPSSNYLISSFKRFDKHPIIRFYNRTLTADAEKTADCAQISVSINTDDQGVFDTCLENEYSIMACALETLKNEKGKRVYSPVNIYNWLDDIRRMGLEQSFKSNTLY